MIKLFEGEIFSCYEDGKNRKVQTLHRLKTTGPLEERGSYVFVREEIKRGGRVTVIQMIQHETLLRDPIIRGFIITNNRFSKVEGISKNSSWSKKHAFARKLFQAFASCNTFYSIKERLNGLHN